MEYTIVIKSGPAPRSIEDGPMEARLPATCGACGVALGWTVDNVPRMHPRWAIRCACVNCGAIEDVPLVEVARPAPPAGE